MIDISKYIVVVRITSRLYVKCFIFVIYFYCTWLHVFSLLLSEHKFVRSTFHSVVGIRKIDNILQFNYNYYYGNGENGYKLPGDIFNNSGGWLVSLDESDR